MRSVQTRKRHQEVVKPVHEEAEDEITLSDAELSQMDGELGSRSPLFDEVLPFFDKQAYVILRDASQTQRQLHLGCPGKADGVYFSRQAKRKFVAEYPIVAIDVSRYPSVANDGEWEYYIKNRYPSVADCTCGLRLFIKDSRTFKRRNLVLSANYFYLTGLNESKKESLIWPCNMAKGVKI